MAVERGRNGIAQGQPEDFVAHDDALARNIVGQATDVGRGVAAQKEQVARLQVYGQQIDDRMGMALPDEHHAHLLEQGGVVRQMARHAGNHVFRHSHVAVHVGVNLLIQIRIGCVGGLEKQRTHLEQRKTAELFFFHITRYYPTQR